MRSGKIDTIVELGVREPPFYALQHQLHLYNPLKKHQVIKAGLIRFALLLNYYSFPISPFAKFNSKSLSFILSITVGRTV